MRIELKPVDGRYEYEDLDEGDIFMVGEELYVMHFEGKLLNAVSLHDGKALKMKGTCTVTLYEKTFVKE